MKVKLSDVASIAEIVASVGVIVSLAFVGLQLNEGNREVRAATVQSVLKAEMDMVAVLIENSGTWDKVLVGEPLQAGEEARRGINLFNLAMLESANRYKQHRAGYLEAQSWSNTQGVLPRLKGLPIYSEWRAAPGGEGQDAEFLKLLDSL